MRARWIVVLIVAAIGATGLLLHFFPPGRFPIYPVCMFHKLTGLHCPGCGGTRAAYALVEGDLARAFRMNAAFILALPVIVYLAVEDRFATRWRVGRRPWFSRTCFIALALFWILRNIPVWPLTLLAPY